MLPVNLSADAGSGVTLLPNVFIDHFMKEANDAQIKLYLYLRRSVSAGIPADLNTLADFLNYSEKDIMRALRYWERKGILSMTFGSAGEIAGIRLSKLSAPSGSRSGIIELCEEITASPSAAEDEPAAAVKAAEKDDMESFRSDNDTACLIMAAEQYSGRPLSEAQVRSLMYIHNKLGFSTELIDYLLQHCIGSGKNSFQYIKATAEAWAEKGISTVEEAKAETAKGTDERTRRIMKLLGRSGEPAPMEQKLISRWLDSYGFSMELIEEACGRTVLAVDANRFAYAETILKMWHDKGVHTMEGVAAADSAFRSLSSPRRESGHSAKNGSYSRIEKQDYDFAELTEKLVNN